MESPLEGLSDVYQIGDRSREFLIHPEQCPAFRRHKIQLAGISQATPDFHFVRQKPACAQLLVAFQGRGRVWVDDGWRECAEGQAYCTPPGRLHAYKGSHDWVIGWITYEASAPWPLDRPVLLDVDPRPLQQGLEGLFHESTVRLETGILELWADLLQMQARQIISSRHPARLWRLWQTVSGNLAEAWTLDRLAKLAGTNPECLRQFTRQETGTTPMRQVTILRMRKGISLLSQGHKIEVVAREVGYENAFAFSAAFKRTIGRSPSAFHPVTSKPAG